MKTLILPVPLNALCVAGLMLTIVSGTQAAKLTQYWPFDDTTGSTNLANSVTGGNTGTLVGLTLATAWITDHPSKLGYSTKSISFSEPNGYINLKNLHLKGSATISLWINPANYDTADIRLFSQVQFVNPFGGVVRLDPFGSGNVQANGGADWVSIGTLDQIPAGSWTHLAFVYDAGLLRLWINGVKQPSSAGVGFDFDAADFGLGARFDLDGALGGPFGNGFMGSMDDVSVWDGPISTSSIAKLSGGTRPTDITDVPDTQVTIPAKLVQYFPLQEAAGSTTVANAVSGGNTGQYLEGDASSAWTNDHPAQLSYSTKALFLDGVAAYVNVGNVKLKDDGTISLWVKPMATDSDTRLYSLVTLPAAFSGVTSLNMLPSGVALKGTVLVYSGAWQQVAPGGTLQQGQWTHLAFAHAAGKVTLFVDGVPVGSASSGLDFDAAELGLGARLNLQFGRPFNGLLDDVSIWDRALQPSSIRKLASGISPINVVDSPATEPPTILAQPAGATVVLAEPATFSVTARGAGTLTYQWQKDGVSVSGATNNPLAIPAVALADAGDYRVLVANAFGSQTSQVARLIVDPGVPVIVTQPASLIGRVGSSASFTVVAAGAKPLSYQWFKGSTAIPGATGTNYTTGTLTAADAGDYKVVVTNVSGSVTSQAATLALVSTPAAVNVNLVPDTGSFVYSGTAAAPDPAGVVWNQITETALAAASNRVLNLVDGDGVASSIKFTSGSFADTLAAFFASNGGGNNMQRTYWNVGAGKVTPAFGFKNLDPNTKYDVYVYGIATDFGTGNTERFSRVGGDSKPVNPVPDTGFPVVGEDYAVFNGITGVTEAMFTAGEDGNSAVFSTVTGLQLIKSSDAPHILKQPAGQFVRPGASVTFGFEVLGAAPLTYQWRKNGTPIAGAASSTYTISSVKVEDAGDYSVVVSNSAGSDTSRSATLRVQTAPPAINVNLHSAAGASEYTGTAAAPDIGTVWNQVTRDMLAADPNRETALTDSDGNPVSIRFFSGDFGDPSGGWYADNGGGNALQASYWHVGGGKVSPEFGFRGLDPAKTYDVYVYGMQTDFGTGWGQAYTLVGGETKTVKQQPDTGFPVEGEDYAVFRGITGVSEVKLTSGEAGNYFSTVTGLQIIQSESVSPAKLTLTRTGVTTVTLSWTGTGALQQANEVTGTWSAVPNASNPFPLPLTGARKFYRVAQ
jgi:Concanavalin A-like lectin/glucanases superfamily/Immunoglobulin I-set domain